jgi:hypothetical protein
MSGDEGGEKRRGLQSGVFGCVVFILGWGEGAFEFSPRLYMTSTTFLTAGLHFSSSFGPPMPLYPFSFVRQSLKAEQIEEAKRFATSGLLCNTILVAVTNGLTLRRSVIAETARKNDSYAATMSAWSPCLYFSSSIVLTVPFKISCNTFASAEEVQGGIAANTSDGNAWKYK